MRVADGRMTTPLSPATAARLEKAAFDNGFDRELPRQGNWLGFASTQGPLSLWLTASDGEKRFVAAVSRENVARALTDHGVSADDRLPSGAQGAQCVPDIPALHRLV